MLHITHHTHSVIACSCHVHIDSIFSAHPVRGVSRIEHRAYRVVVELSSLPELLSAYHCKFSRPKTTEKMDQNKNVFKKLQRIIFVYSAMMVTAPFSEKLQFHKPTIFLSLTVKTQWYCAREDETMWSALDIICRRLSIVRSHACKAFATISNENRLVMDAEAVVGHGGKELTAVETYKNKKSLLMFVSVFSKKIWSQK